jgi:chemotaxis protein methyltransferase CheR
VIASSGASLSDVDFTRFCDFFYQLTGIKYAEHKRYFVDKRVAACVAESGEPDFRHWFASLRLGSDPAMVQAVINRLTVNETYFGREDYQFQSLVRSALPAVMAERARTGVSGPVRIGSFPCSTGEEPYSIAIALIEHWPDLATVDVTIVGGDIDTNALAVARAGIYGTRSMHLVPARERATHFEQLGADRWRVSADLRGAVDFRTLNIGDTATTRALPLFDVIFCRNLLIYFDQLSSRTAAENIYGMLRPRGFLFLGHSESMSRISPIFQAVRFPDGIAYQRPLEAQP